MQAAGTGAQQLAQQSTQQLLAPLTASLRAASMVETAAVAKHPNRRRNRQLLQWLRRQRLSGCLMLCMQGWIIYEYIIVAHVVATHNSNISNIL
jgi:hypothetical protein